MAILSGTRHDPLRAFKYIVSVQIPDGSIVEMGFQRVSGLREETEVVEYRNGDEQGGVRKLPGLTSYDNIILERGQLRNGATDAEKLLEWRQTVQTALEDGNENENIRGNILIWVYNRPSFETPDMTYQRLAVWPTVYEHSDLSGTDSEVFIERVEFACEGGGVSMGG